MFERGVIWVCALLICSLPLHDATQSTRTTIDRSLFIGSTQLNTHFTNIQTFVKSICESSTVPKNVEFTRIQCVADSGGRLVQPNLMIGDNTIFPIYNETSKTDFIKPIKSLIDDSTPGDSEDLSFIDGLTSLNTNLYTLQDTNITVTDDTGNTTWYINQTVVYTTLTMNTSMILSTSSNPTLNNALVHGLNTGPPKLPEMLIIQDQPYLPLYPTYRDKSLAPALHQILTYAREAEYVLLLPSWADPNPNVTDLSIKGLNYTNRLTLQKGMDDAYHEIEQTLQTWINVQSYPIDVPGANNISIVQAPPSVATVPLGPVFNDIINNAAWEIPTYNIYNVTSNRTKSFLDGSPPIQYQIVTPTMNNTGTTHTVDGVSLLYNQPSGTLTLAGEYVVSLLLFSTMYNRSVTGSIAPNLTVYYDVDEMGGPQVDNVPLIIPYITNEAATQIQQIVDARVNASNFPLLPYKWLSPTSPPTDIPTPTPTASPSSPSSSSSSTSSSITPSSSSLSSSSITPSSSSLSSSSSPSNSSSSTGVVSPDQNDQSSSSVEGIKAYWAGIIAGIIAVSILLLYCYRKKQTRDKAGYGPMQFDMEKGYEVELVD